MNYGLEIALVALAVMVVGLIYYVLTRESVIIAQIRGVAREVEECHRELFLMDKRLKEEIEAAASLRESLAHNEGSEQSLLRALSSIEENLKAHGEKTESRLRHLEERLRNLSLPASLSGIDETKLISLYSGGAGIDAIARELRLSKAEVEFVLKIHHLR